MKEIYDKIYEKVKVELLKDLPEKYVENVVSGYYKKLVIAENLIEDFQMPIAKFIDVYAATELEDLSSMNLEDKLRKYCHDSAIAAMRFISGSALKYAEKRIDSENKDISVSQQEADELITKVTQLSKTVEYFNENEVPLLLSETINDLLYASGQSENLSFRLNRSR